MSDRPLLISGPKPNPIVRVEIVRSFSYKLNCANHGGAQYESRDFFASQKAECAIEDSADVSAALFAFCRSEVIHSVKEYLREMAEQAQQRRRGAA